MKETDFIGQMVQETIEISQREEHKVLDFGNEVDRIIHLQFDEKRFCHIIRNKKQSIEIPQNWGPFKNRICHEIFIDRNDDRYDFLEILNQFFNAEFNSVKLVTAPVVEKLIGRKAA